MNPRKWSKNLVTISNCIGNLPSATVKHGSNGLGNVEKVVIAEPESLLCEVARVSTELHIAMRASLQELVMFQSIDQTFQCLLVRFRPHQAMNLLCCRAVTEEMLEQERAKEPCYARKEHTN